MNERLQAFLDRFSCNGTSNFDEFWRSFAAVEQLDPLLFDRRAELLACLKARGMLRHGGVSVSTAVHPTLIYRFLHPV
jgi:hypothetical protein